MNMVAPLNSFFNKYIFPVLLLILIPKVSCAIDIHGLYVSSCKRELGVILRVEKSKIKLLTLSGDFKEIPRHEIIYFTYYSIDSFPGVKIKKNELEDVVQIDTVQNNKMVKLVEGWPIDYSVSDISFLTLGGHEVLISRDNIWKINLKKIKKAINFENNNDTNYQFVHPYPFRLCPALSSENKKNGSKTIAVYPQQMLYDSVQIKIELDRLQKGRERIDKYDVYQQFYAVPQIYKNISSLGYWFSYGSRYGASKSRNNNLTPILQNEFSSGIFGYQHLLLTGSAPMSYSIHEEPQTQVYYRFKADYFHMGVMLDPSMFLVPWEKYEWKREDLRKLDDRVNPNLALELGFDYSNFTIQWYMDSLNMGVNSDTLGYYGPAVSYRIGLSYQNPFFKAEAQFDPSTFIDNVYYDFSGETEEETGIGSDEIKIENQVGLIRLNFETTYFENINIRYSFIYRRIGLKNSYDGYEVDDDFTASDEIKSKLFNYKSDSFTNAMYLIHSFKNKYSLGAFLALEYHTAKSKHFQKEYNDDNFYPKCGVYASLFF